MTEKEFEELENKINKETLNAFDACMDSIEHDLYPCIVASIKKLKNNPNCKDYDIPALIDTAFASALSRALDEEGM